MIKPAYVFLSFLLFAASCSKDQSEVAVIPADWMNQLINSNSGKDITLLDITMPASHDAGMYVISGCAIGNACNTQTQHLDMTDQLKAGIRIFDIRPVLNNGEYYTQHFTACNGYGCRGDLMQNILSQTKAFLDAHSELVILKLSHFCGTGADDSTFVNLVNNTLGDRIYKEDENAIPFIKRPLRGIIPPGQAGKAVIIYGESLQDRPENRAKGMFTGAILPTEGGWSNVYIFDSLKADQLRLFSSYSNTGSALFEFSWTLTQNASLAVDCALSPNTATSIRDLAEIADSALTPTLAAWIGDGTIQKGKIPNIISVDFADKLVTEQCVRISRLNLDAL